MEEGDSVRTEVRSALIGTGKLTRLLAVTVAASLERDLDLGVQILWASRFASLRGQPLLLLYAVRKPGVQQRTVEVALAEDQGEEKSIISGVRCLR